MENTATRSQQQQVVERKARPQKDQALNCPRCNSTNTKFCYYNNYSLTQPRYFCKTCRRYWTEGGSLRNVPVGGGSRKNKRHSSSTNSATTPSTSKNFQSHDHQQLIPQHPPPPISLSSYEGHDLNLAFPTQSLSTHGGSGEGGGALSAMELLRSGISARGLGPFVPMPMPMPDQAGSMIYGTSFGLQEFKNNSNIIGGGGGGGYAGGNMQGSVQEGGGGGGRLLFPFEPVSMKSTSEIDQQNRAQGGDHHNTMLWNGMMGSGGSW